MPTASAGPAPVNLSSRPASGCCSSSDRPLGSTSSLAASSPCSPRSPLPSTPRSSRRQAPTHQVSSSTPLRGRHPQLRNPPPSEHPPPLAPLGSHPRLRAAAPAARPQNPRAPHRTHQHRRSPDSHHGAHPMARKQVAPVARLRLLRALPHPSEHRILALPPPLLRGMVAARRKPRLTAFGDRTRARPAEPRGGALTVGHQAMVEAVAAAHPHDRLLDAVARLEELDLRMALLHIAEPPSRLCQIDRPIFHVARHVATKGLLKLRHRHRIRRPIPTRRR